MPQYYGDVVVTQKRRLRLAVTADKQPTAKQLLAALNNKRGAGSVVIDDTTDDEDLNTVSVDDCSDLTVQESDCGEDDT